MKRKSIRLFKPSFNNDEIVALKKIFKRSWIGYGKEVKRFEEHWSKYIGIKYSVGVTSCSAALHIALASKNFKKTFFCTSKSKNILCVSYNCSKIFSSF